MVKHCVDLKINTYINLAIHLKIEKVWTGILQRKGNFINIHTLINKI